MNEFISGAISGIFQTLIGHPFDTYKVMMQNNELNMKTFRRTNPFNGVLYPLSSSIINCSLSFGINSYLKQNTSFDTTITGFISGVSVSPVIFYFDYFKIKCQVSDSTNFSNSPWNRNGFAMTVARESIAFSIYFKTYEYMHDICKYNSYISGGMAGLMNWTITYPIDIIKTRQTIYNISIIDAYKMGNYWKGYAPCAFRSIIVNSIGFYVFDKCNQYLN